MKLSLANLAPVRQGEWRLLLSLILILAMNALVSELSDIVSVAGFIENVGTPQLPWLWVIDMVITLAFASSYVMIVDRMKRLHLLSWLMGALAFCYLLIAILFTLGAPSWVNYALLHVLAEQQWVVFPLVFWAFANDIYSLSQSKRLFPIIGIGYAMGSILGNSTAVAMGFLIQEQVGATYPLLLIGVAVFMLAIALLWLTFRNHDLRARQSTEAPETFRETLAVGQDFFQSVPVFKWFALLMLMLQTTAMIARYFFFDLADAQGSNIQTLYGTFNLTFIISGLVLQSLITGRLLPKVAHKNAFLLYPSLLTLAFVAALFVPGLATAVGAYMTVMLIDRVWDEPTRKSLLNLVPDERRGRISTLLDTYFYIFATFCASLFLGLLGLALSAGWLSVGQMRAIYIFAGTISAGSGVLIALNLRKVYDNSLLNWRLSRSRRKSVLDGIEF